MTELLFFESVIRQTLPTSHKAGFKIQTRQNKYQLIILLGEQDETASKFDLQHHCILYEKAAPQKE